LKTVVLRDKKTQRAYSSSPEPSPNNSERYNVLYRAEKQIAEIRDKVAYNRTWFEALPVDVLAYARQAIIAMDTARHNLFWAREALSTRPDGDDHSTKVSTEEPEK